MTAWILSVAWTALFAFFLAVSYYFLGSKSNKRKVSFLHSHMYVPHLGQLIKSSHNPFFQKNRYIYRINFVINRFIFITSHLVVMILAALSTSSIMNFSPFHVAGTNSYRHTQKSINSWIYLIDVSGSMNEPFSYDQTAQKSKMTLLKKVLCDSVKKYDRSCQEMDLMGLNTFARVCTTAVPMTYNRDILIDTIQTLCPVQEDEINGTATGYALYKAVIQMQATHVLKGENKDDDFAIFSRCVVISDGREQPHPDDRQDLYRSTRFLQALELAKKQGVIVDYILLGNDLKKISLDEIEKLRQSVVATGGEFIRIAYESALANTLDTFFASLSPQKIPFSSLQRSWSCHFLVTAAMSCTLFIMILRCLRHYMNSSKFFLKGSITSHES